MQTWLLMRGQIFALDFLDAVRIIMPIPPFLLSTLLNFILADFPNFIKGGGL